MNRFQVLSSSLVREVISFTMKKQGFDSSRAIINPICFIETETPEEIGQDEHNRSASGLARRRK